MIVVDSLSACVAYASTQSTSRMSLNGKGVKMMKTFPRDTANRNVPKDSLLICEFETMSGEITWTVYVDKDGNMFQVTDWVNDKPAPVTLSYVCRETLLSEKQIEGAWNSWVKETRGA